VNSQEVHSLHGPRWFKRVTRHFAFLPAAARAQGANEDFFAFARIHQSGSQPGKLKQQASDLHQETQYADYQVLLCWRV
jgi:hypothetical protein